MLTQLLSDGAIRQTIEASYQMLARTAVPLGVAYHREIDDPHPAGKTTIRVKVTPTKPGGGRAVDLTYTGTLDVVIDNSRQNLDLIDMKCVGGTMSGRNVFDLVRGQMQQGMSTSTIHLKIRQKAANPMSEPMIRSTVKTKVTMETLSAGSE